jgi:two-component system, LytTR family, response regulator
MIKAIIVDDEEKSLKNLELLLTSYCSEVEIINRANNALEAVKMITAQKPDVVFLDVNMPGYTGFDVLENIRETSCLVIFTTAHKNYAINALRKGAFDYLLKPIDTDELKDCISRVKEVLSRPEVRNSGGQGIIELSVKDGIFFIKPNDIVRLEASGSYTTFHLENNVRHMASKSMKEFEALLDPAIFFRCHNSHIINLKKVTKFIHSNGYFAELVNGATIEVSRRNKDLFLEKLKNLRLE